MTTLLGIARFTFHEGTVDEFKRLSRRCAEIVAEQDRGTLRYDVFLTADERRAVVIEEYVDENALMEHGRHIGDELSAAVLATAEVHGELLGDISADLQDRLREGPVTALLPVRT